ncbi:MAG TPA: hypothetical protein VFX15_04880 [Actinomycetes bacterium]|nr:hypothetical protein [Actinomycetes bacterium]
MGRLTAASSAMALAASLLTLPVVGAGTASAAPLPESTSRPSLAASRDALPSTVLKIRSIDWVNRTGVVRVTARVKCTGQGSFRWETALQQKRARDRGSANVRCNGEHSQSTIVLDAHRGRFHPGPAEFMRGSITCGDDVCIGFATLRHIRISPR